MEKRFYYKMDRRSKRITIIVAALLGVLAIGFVFLTSRDYLRYFPAWVMITLLCLLLLCILSVPRYLKIDKDSLEIHCILNLMKIHIEDVEIVRPLERDEARSLIPLIASYGFFGYFGFFFSLREWNLYNVYTSSRSGRILIEDIYESSYVVNCDDTDTFIEMVLAARDAKRAEIFRHIK